MKKFFAKLTGGRPMTKLQHSFTDTVSGRPVYRWRDRLGRVWLAERSWSIFRVEKEAA